MMISINDTDTYWLDAENNVIYLETISKNSKLVIGDKDWPIRGKLVSPGEITFKRYNLLGVRYDRGAQIIKQLTKDKNPEYFL